MSRLLVMRSLGFSGRPTVVALKKLVHEVFTLDNHGDAKGIFPVDIIDADLENTFEEINIENQN
jgi:hypothetical protein